MTRAQVEAGVRRAVRRASAQRVSARLSDTVAGNLAFDSLSLIALACALEVEFMRPIPLQEWRSIDPATLDVAKLCDYIQARS